MRNQGCQQCGQLCQGNTAGDGEQKVKKGEYGQWGADLTLQLSSQLWGDNRTVSLSVTAERASKGAGGDVGRLPVSFCVIWHTFHMEGR